jgi:hydroxymethylpyrimidine/phosphomethylpyrimidine kinase / thiaminase
VQDIHIVPAGFVQKQINAALEDVGADVVKLGISLSLSLSLFTKIL